MSVCRKIEHRLQALFQRRKLDAEMDEEMRSHIEMRMQQNIEDGMEPEEARYAALRQFGWVESVKERCREQRGVSWFENFFQDIRYGARMLQTNPGFTAVAVLTLALGIGSNTATFTLINNLVLKPVSGRDTGQLVSLYSQDPRLELLLHVRPSPMANAETLLQTVRAELHRFDPRLPVLSAKSLRYHLSSSFEIWIMRSGATLFATLGAAALLLSVVGVYGVMAYSVACRTRELGIRMALGAGRRSVLGLIINEGVKLSAIGLLIGLLLALGLAKAMAGFLFEIQALDPLIFFAAPAFLAVAVLLACYVPARRAARTDPMIVLRQQ